MPLHRTPTFWFTAFIVVLGVVSGVVVRDFWIVVYSVDIIAFFLFGYMSGRVSRPNPVVQATGDTAEQNSDGQARA